MKSINDVSESLVDFLRKGRNVEAYAQLYASDANCIEADASRSRSGRDRLEADMRAFNEAHSFEYTSVEGPVIAGDRFALALCFAAKNLESGDEFTVQEIGIYTVEDGKIVKEQYLYDLPSA